MSVVLETENTELWRKLLELGESDEHRKTTRIMRLLPGSPRCKSCYAPFGGFGSTIAWRLYHKRRSNINPNLCTYCEEFVRKHPGGVELEVSLLFADVRGSTTIAEGMSPTQFQRLINRFYIAATRVLADSDAIIDKIIGDQAAGIYTPGFSGVDHAQIAIDAAREILKLTGHGSDNGPWIPLGVGVHTGRAFVGSLGSDGATDMTVLGDAPNTAARLSSRAGVGEILISDDACRHAGYERFEQLQHKDLELKGKDHSVGVRVLQV